MLLINASQKNAAGRIKALKDKLGIFSGMTSAASRRKTIEVFGRALSPIEVVSNILRDVRVRGDKALFEFTKKLDGAVLNRRTLKVSPPEMKRARKSVSKKTLKAMRSAASNIRKFQKRIKIAQPGFIKGGGKKLGIRYRPLDRVAVYVPGGSAVLCSSVLMDVIPARVAGVGEIAVATPPRRDGTLCPELLAACDLVGVTEVYRMGGAAAIAALAFGTESVRPVDKIVGAGNIFVTLAKKEVYGQVDIDMLAGPSDILVIADSAANPAYVAADLLSQAEHNPGSAVLITTSRTLAAGVKKELARQIKLLSRSRETLECLNSYGAIIIAKSIRQACEVANEIAPEHLELMVKNPARILGAIKNAGAVFLGRNTPEAVGDYIAGPSHTLPTGSTARFFSGLCVNDFLKRTSVIEYTAKALAKDSADVIELARSEKLDGHANSVRIRLKDR